jgi:glycosyltransferase involved in cell wall biosynthesis
MDTRSGVDVRKFSPAVLSEQVCRGFGVDGWVGDIYSGLHGFAQGLDVVVDAAERLIGRRDIRFVMVGDGVVKRDLMWRAATLGLENTTFFDPVLRERVPAILGSMDIALASLTEGVPQATIQKKICEVMVSGLLVVTAARDEANDLIRRDRLGRAVTPGAVADFADAIRDLADDAALRQCAERAVQAAGDRFDRSAIMAGLDGFLSGVLKNHG